MTIPDWASSMIENYRAAFKAEWKQDFQGSDEQIWEICETIFDDNSPELQDEARLLAMKDLSP